MNPDSAIRPWLLMVGKKFGIRLAYNYNFPDQSSRPQEPYFTYRVLSGRQVMGNVHREMSQDGYTAIWGGWQSQETVVRIRLYREVNGVNILTQCAIAAQAAEPIKRHFDKSGCAFKEINESIEDETPDENSITDGDFTDQIVQRMDCIFNNNVSTEIRETNGVVETLDIDLGL